MSRILSRLSEPSTWAGISVIAGLFGVPPAVVPAVAKAGVGLSALLAVLLPEKAR